MEKELSNILCDIDLGGGVKVKGQIMYFLVNASLKSLDLFAFNFTGV